MKVRDIASGATLESYNAFVCEQWKKHPEKYKPVSEQPEQEPVVLPAETESEKEVAEKVSKAEEAPKPKDRKEKA